jgi:hypothetical protein
MKQYLAIMKRDYGANGGSILWLPTPIFFLLNASFYTWLLSPEFDIQAWCFLYLSLFGAYNLLGNLSLSHGHNLGFFAPDFKNYQFNYSTSLVFVSSIITCVIFSDSIYEFWVSLSLLWFFTSLMFFFIKREIWKRAHIILFGSWALFSIFMFYLGRPEDIFSFLPKIYASVWSLLSIPIIGITTSFVCLALSFKSFLIAKHNYLKPKEYDSDVVPINWKRHSKNSNFNVLQLFTNTKLTSKTWGKFESRILFGLDLGRHTDLIYLGLFGARSHSSILKFVIGFLLIIFIPPLFFAIDVNQEAILIPICIFMLFYLVIVNSVVSLKWINNRNKISELWLWDTSLSRPRFMLKLAMLFAERIGRVSLVACLAFILLATIISGLKGLMVVSVVALGGLILSLMLQMAYVLFVTVMVKNTAWLRYVTFVFTAGNFIGWLTVLFLSVEHNNYWILLLAIGSTLAICSASIKYWCRYDKELTA